MNYDCSDRRSKKKDKKKARKLFPYRKGGARRSMSSG
jgi:hypothetical protein